MGIARLDATDSRAAFVCALDHIIAEGFYSRESFVDDVARLMGDSYRSMLDVPAQGSEP